MNTETEDIVNSRAVDHAARIVEALCALWPPGGLDVSDYTEQLERLRKIAESKMQALWAATTGHWPDDKRSIITQVFWDKVVVHWPGNGVYRVHATWDHQIADVVDIDIQPSHRAEIVRLVVSADGNLCNEHSKTQTATDR